MYRERAQCCVSAKETNAEKSFLNPLKKRKNIFAKPIDKTQGGWYNTKEKEVEQAVLTLPYMTRMGRYRKFL